MLVCVSLNSFETDSVKCLVKSLCVKVYLLGFNNEVGESFRTESSQKDTETRSGSNFSGSNKALVLIDDLFFFVFFFPVVVVIVFVVTRVCVVFSKNIIR